MVNLVLIFVNLVNLVNLRPHQKPRIHHFYKPYPAGSINKMVKPVFLGILTKILGKMVKMPTTYRLSLSA